MRLIRVAGAVVLLLALVNSALAQNPAPTVVLPARLDPIGAYILGPGDQILVRAANAPELNEKTIRIDLSGFVNLPVVGRIQAGGITVEALERELVRRLKVFLEEPDVSVSVLEYQSQPVSVFGDVSTPGVHQLQGRKSLVELIAMVGGVKPESGPFVLITRRLEYGRIPLPGAADDPTGKYSIAQVEIRPLIQAKTPEKDILIQPYDVISVPRAEYIYVAGEVIKSGTVALSEKQSLSIVEALSSSGGLTKTADSKRARILRATRPDLIRPQEPVDVAKIMKGQSPDVQLMAGDILVVPSSVSKKAIQRAIEVAVQIGSVILSAGIVNGTI